ncbi:MAG: DUF6701 domain-containing protein [Telluria sp.]
MAAWRAFRRLLAVLVLAGAGGAAHADTAIRLFQSHAGNVNFTGTQVTLRSADNASPCTVYGPNTARTAKLSGIPAGATILSAHLYWAGSNYNPDYTVTFEGATVIAATDRRYYSYTIGGDHNYFSGAADVTAQVKSKRNGDYSVKGLTVDYDAPYCAVSGVLGGFSLLVVYSEASEPYRVLNLYEGFQFMRYTGITLNLSNFKIPNPLGSATGRVGHITWEGDTTLQQNGENLSFNGTAMTDAINPAQNQFNSKSNINNDKASYGIDFDAYTLASPVIAAGQTTATTRYESGQDLVLLSAEIIALPNVPASDLSINMQRMDELLSGEDVRYEIAVKNNGPTTETGPVVVTDTLPSGLNFVSASGSGWSCGAAGQTVTCSNTATLAAGAALPTLTITARVTGSGSLTNSAIVSGRMFDYVAANNSASAQGTVAGGGLRFVLTNAACEVGIRFGAPGQTCTTVLPNMRAGDQRAIYITAVDGGIPTRLHKSRSIDVAFQFALSCHNPEDSAGVKAEYGGITLPECASGGSVPATWTNAAWARFPGDTASFGAYFQYQDVGEIQLYLREYETGKVGTSGGAFRSNPAEVRLTNLRSGTRAIPASPADNDAFVIKAGTDFTFTAGAYSSTGALTPNFGRERAGETFAVPAVSVGATAQAAKNAMTSLPALKGSYGAISGGTAVGTFQWHEAGIINLVPGLEGGDYLDTDISVVANKVKAGRFIPDRFDTEITAPMECMPNMKCPADAVGAAYSKQPFTVRVLAHSATDAPIRNYVGTFARKVELSAIDAAGGSATNPGAGALGGTEVTDTAFAAGEGAAVSTYTLTKPFVADSPNNPQAPPVTIYLRAKEKNGDGVSSDRAADSQEAGLQIVSGRLLVPNGTGSERISLPVKLSAQYFSADSQWELTQADNTSEVDSSKAAFSNFSGGITAGMPGLQPQAKQTLAGGVTSYTLKLSSARAGGFDLLVNHIPWLPSTRGRFKFGIRTAPLIYIREAY